MMFSQSKSSVNAAACLAAMLVMASTTQAQLSTVPKRYRSSDAKAQQNGSNNLRRKDERQLESMPLQESEFSLPRNTRVSPLSMEQSEFEMSIPIQTRVMSLPSIELSEMSLPLMEAEMSLPLMEAELSLSMDLSGGDESAAQETVNLQNSGSGDGSTLILASFLAGISALVVGAMALFVKMRRVHGRQVEEVHQPDGSDDFRVVSFGSPEECDDVLSGAEGGRHEIVID